MVFFKFSFSPVTLNNRLLFVLETEVERRENMNKVNGAEGRGGEAKPLGKLFSVYTASKVLRKLN